VGDHICNARPPTRSTINIVTSAAKIPGWGLIQVLDARASPRGEEALILTEDSEAPFWAGLEEVRRHRGRIIYRDTTNTTQEGT
jgi:hypothetical protein